MRREYHNHRAKIIVFAYILPFLAVAVALYTFQQQRDQRRAQAVTTFAQAREAVLFNCAQVEIVKKQLRITLIEQKAKAKQDLEAFKKDPHLYSILKDQLDRGLKRQDKIIRRFAPVDCEKLPFIREGLTPYPPDGN
jgi:uncharacterized protein HemX